MSATAATAEDDGPVVWCLPELFRSAPSSQSTAQYPGTEVQKRPVCLLVLNQPLANLGLIRGFWQHSCLRVAADGGANRLYEVGRLRGDDSFDDLDVVIGDLDSLWDNARTYFESRSRPAKVIRDPDQYSTDFSKAVNHIRGSRPGPVDIIAVGGLGGRVDQGLSQLHHLYLFQQDPRYADGRIYLFSSESMTFMLKAGKHHIVVRDGGDDLFEKYVGILPLKEPSRITTVGLEWDVEDWPTEFGGQMSTSNHVLPNTRVVEVATTRDVLFTIALKSSRDDAFQNK